MRTCIGCEHNIGNLNTMSTYYARDVPDICWGCYTWYRSHIRDRKHYVPNGRTCIGCAHNKVGVAYMSVTAGVLNGNPKCSQCYLWDYPSSERWYYKNG